MVLRLLFILSFCSLPYFFYAQSSPTRGEVLSYTLEDSLGPNEIRALYQSFSLPELLAPITYSLNVYKFIYWTE